VIKKSCLYDLNIEIDSVVGNDNVCFIEECVQILYKLPVIIRPSHIAGIIMKTSRNDSFFM
jgi:hypothetical protein